MTVWRGILAWWMAMQCYIHGIRSKLALNLCSGTYWLCDLIYTTHLTSLISSVIQGCDLLSYPHIWYFARATLLKGCDENKRESGWSLSTGPGAEPRLTYGRCTQEFLGVIGHVCAMYTSVWDTHRLVCAVWMHLRINAVTGESTSSLLGFTREVLTERWHLIRAILPNNK